MFTNINIVYRAYW